MTLPPSDSHDKQPDASFDGGDLDCGNGLLLLIRKHLDELAGGQLLEIKSTEISVEEDLPAWCRLTKNSLVSWTKQGRQRSYLVQKRVDTRPLAEADLGERPSSPTRGSGRKADTPNTAVPPLSVMGIGSWPRPGWMLRAIHKYVSGNLSEHEFNELGNDAVRLSIESQLRAGVDVVTDGEQRRDNYASFVGMHLENVQLIPLTDLLPMVDHPEKFEQHLQQLDVAADVLRHPAVFGKLKRKGTLAAHECEFVRTLTDRPIKVSLPGPYLLTRTMFLDCFKEKAYALRDDLATDIIAILRDEIADLLQAGAALIQLDEPILTEVVMGTANAGHTFMCGALSERGDMNAELEFALDVLNRVCDGFPKDRLAMHVCRGNWSPNENVALTGGYEALLPLFKQVRVGTLFLEYCTPRAGDLKVLSELPAHLRIGLGVVNPKATQVEGFDEVLARVEQGAALIGSDRLILNPDCGFATFADNPVADAATAEAKLEVISTVARRVRL